MGADGSSRTPSHLRRRAAAFGLGFALGLAPFLLPFLDSLTYLIPLSLRSELRATTALLGGFLALVVRERASPGSLGRKVLQGWAFAAPAGLVLLIFFQQFVVRFPYEEGLFAAEIIAPPRLGTCPCEAPSDEGCLRELSLDPAVLAQCWKGSLRMRNRIAWSLAYLLAIGGVQSFLCLLWARSRKEAQRPGGLPARHTPGTERTLFLSYSREDRDFVEHLADDLQARGIAVWWDSPEMDVGDSLHRKIEAAIANSAWFGIVLSPNSITSRWVQNELDQAQTLEIEGALKILPILQESCPIPPSLRGKVRADFTSSYEEGLEALLRGLRPS